MAFDATEYRRWVATAGRQLRIAAHTAEGGFHDAAVLHAEQAAQCALKALLHAVGAGPEARGHSLVDLAAGADRLAGLQLPGDQQEALGDLASQYQPSRYPDALPGGTPADHYGPGSSARAIATAEAMLNSVEAHFARLVASEKQARSASGPNGPDLR
jgi:HEPN domain-containing protein